MADTVKKESTSSAFLPLLKRVRPALAIQHQVSLVSKDKSGISPAMDNSVKMRIMESSYGNPKSPKNSRKSLLEIIPCGILDLYQYTGKGQRFTSGWRLILNINQPYMLLQFSSRAAEYFGRFWRNNRARSLRH